MSYNIKKLNIEKWNTADSESGTKRQLNEFVKKANEEILVITNRNWLDVDKRIYELIKKDNDFKVRIITTESNFYIKKIQNFISSIIIDKEKRYVPLCVLVIDSKYACLGLPISNGEYNWKTTYFTDNKIEIGQTKLLFERIWKRHPLNKFV